MIDPERQFRRDDARDRTRRDIDRLTRRVPGGRFWQSIALVGSVGWPIVILSTGGALLGHYLDGRMGTGIRLTLTLLVAGTVTGTIIAYRAVRRNGS